MYSEHQSAKEQTYWGECSMIRLMGRVGMKIRAGDGCEEMGFPEMLSTPLFYHANPGDRLQLLDSAYKFNVATYRPEINHQWIYTYTYAADQSWTMYNGDLSGDSYRQDDYAFEDHTYFRVCIRKISGEDFENADNINDILAFQTSGSDDRDRGSHDSGSKLWIETEAERVAKHVNEIRETGDLTFILMADSHYNVNGTWDDTRRAVELLSREVKLNGIIHLGDISDGMVTGDATRHYVNLELDSLRTNEVPVWVALGNHDTNYFRNNPERFSTEEQSELYLDGREMRYHIDLPGLRLIFLDSFDPDEHLRYGYSQECINWLEQTLDSTPEDSVALILSHLPPTTRLQYWAKQLRGDSEMMEVLSRNSARILAWLNGHNHADKLDNAEGFPIISIVNAKCEAFTEHKTEGFITPDRKLDDVTQEAFDVFIINAEKRTVRFIRFGAGDDRTIINGRAEWA